MATKIETARQMVYTTAWRFQNGEYPVREISMAKLYAVADRRRGRRRVHPDPRRRGLHEGGTAIERAWRDMRLNRIGAGTDEIMLDVIGRSYGL